MENKKFYTGNGDKGYTKTLSHFRISKADPMIELLGTLDEFTSALGVAKSHTQNRRLIEDIESIQKRLIDVLGEIAGGKQTVTAECVSKLENMIDEYQAEIGEFQGFVLPGGCQSSAMLDVARTVMRRAERVAAKAGQFGRIQANTMTYFNRLCDLIYCFARYADVACKNKPVEDKSVETVLTNNPILGISQALSLRMAKELSEVIEQEARKIGIQVVVAILDQGANIMLLHSMDNAYIASSQIAQDKAYTAVSLKMPTEQALELSRGGALDGLSATSSNRLLLLGGGIPLKQGGIIQGGLGVSGGTAQQDIALAEFGARYFEGRII